MFHSLILGEKNLPKPNVRFFLFPLKIGRSFNGISFHGEQRESLTTKKAPNFNGISFHRYIYIHIYIYFF